MRWTLEGRRRPHRAEGASADAIGAGGRQVSSKKPRVESAPSSASTGEERCPAPGG